MTELTDWLRGRPWDPPAAPETVLGVPTMISPQELTLLYRLAAERYDGRGVIVDAGCFLGGSTAALAEGIEANRGDLPRRPVHTYDRFVLEDVSKNAYPQLVADIAVGESTLPRFRQVLGDRLDRVEVHDGDIRRERWGGDPISILFIDVAKSWEINDHVNREFFPCLVPGESVVIQQDYVHEWCPWLHITMELLGDAFEFAGSLPYATAVFVPTRAISRDEIPANLREELDDETKLELFDRAARRFAGEDLGIIQLARAALLADMGDPAAGVALVDRTLAEHGGHERVAIVSAAMRDQLAAQPRTTARRGPRRPTFPRRWPFRGPRRGRS